MFDVRRGITLIMASAMLAGCGDRGSAPGHNRKSEDHLSLPPLATRQEQLARQQQAEERQKLPLPEAFVRPQDQDAVRRLRGGQTGPVPCADLDLNRGMDQCFRFGASKHWQGLWYSGFEDSEFCDEPAAKCPNVGTDVSLDFGSAEPKEARFPPGGLYAVEFIGRASLYPGTFGHMGMSKNEVLVDRLISIRTVRAPKE